MTKTERSRIVALGGIGAVIILLVWGIIATLPKKEDGREEEVRLRSEIKDNFTLKDMLGSVEKEMENRRENRMPGGGNYGMDEPEDTVSPESEIQRIRERSDATSRPSEAVRFPERNSPPLPPSGRRRRRTVRRRNRGRRNRRTRFPKRLPGEDSTACALSGRTRGTSYGHSYIPHRRSWSERR